MLCLGASDRSARLHLSSRFRGTKSVRRLTHVKSEIAITKVKYRETSRESVHISSGTCEKDKDIVLTMRSMSMLYADIIIN